MTSTTVLLKGDGSSKKAEEDGIKKKNKRNLH